MARHISLVLQTVTCSFYCALITTDGMEEGNMATCQSALMTPGVHAALSDKARCIRQDETRLDLNDYCCRITATLHYISSPCWILYVNMYLGARTREARCLSEKPEIILVGVNVRISSLQSVFFVAALYILATTGWILPHASPFLSLSTCCLVGIRQRQP